VPFSNSGYALSIVNWFYRGAGSRYKIIFDNEAFYRNFNITQYKELYPGVRTIATVSNPWRRMFDIYIEEISNSTSNVPNDFNLFVEQLYASTLPTSYLQSAHLNTEDGATTDYIFRVENIVTEFKKIQTFFSNDTPLQHLPPYISIAYVSEYSDQSIRLVEEMFIEDIEQFGYTWDL
jgi:hypothetical protein